jgi:hypothetical protein
MANPGYQDWGRYNVPSADNIISEAPGPQSFWFGPSADCSPWTWALLTMDTDGPNNIYSVTVSWAGYTSSLENLTQDSICVGPSSHISYAVPVKGRTVQLQYQLLFGSATSGITYGIAGLSHPISKYDARQNFAVLVSTNLNMIANSQATVGFAFWYEGPITLTISSHLGGPATVALQQYDRITNAWLEVGRFQVANDSASLPFYISLLPAPARLIVMNGGTAQTIQVNAVVRATH